MGRAFLLQFMACALACAAFASDQVPSPRNRDVAEARNKAIAGRVFEEIFNQGKFQVADEIYAKEFVNHGLHRSFDLQADQAAVHEEKRAFPDLKMTVDQMVAEGDLVTVIWTFRGTNSAAGYGLPATGVKVELRGITVWRIVDGKIREEWSAFDQMQAASQFAAQLKWQLAGLAFAAVVLLLATVWAAGRIRKGLARAC